MSDQFDTKGMFDNDYLYFYSNVLTEERTEREVALIRELLALPAGAAVLDLACGHGRISNRLAADYQITGLDITPLFLELAREDAAARGVQVDYLLGDMRQLPFEAGQFDVVINWFTAYGYFEDDDNRRVLQECQRVLKPGGRLVLEMNNRDFILKNYQPTSLTEREGNYMVDRHRFDALTGRSLVERIIFRDGKIRKTNYFTRLFTYTELRDWLLQAGFQQVAGYDQTGQPFSLDSRRMVVVAQKLCRSPPAAPSSCSSLAHLCCCSVSSTRLRCSSLGHTSR